MKLDEFEIDDVFTTPPNKISEKDIINFAQEFDPQYMHLDKEKATEGRFMVSLLQVYTRCLFHSNYGLKQVSMVKM